MSLGPNGELRYPSYPPGSNGADGYSGAGEFQCYDKYTLARLKRHAESSGQPLWGLSGPHDGPRYDESPESSAFFREPGGLVGERVRGVLPVLVRRRAPGAR